MNPAARQGMTSHVKEMIAGILFGWRYSGPHDYVTLRRRYAYSRGPTWMDRRWRVLGIVFSVSTRLGVWRGWKISVYPVTMDHDPYWREEKDPRIAMGWETRK